MAIKIDSNMSAVAYHIIDGAVSFPYAIDAHSAISRFPGEWSRDPWSAADMAAARSASGEPDIEPTPEEQAAIDAHAKAVAEANERLAKFRAEQAEKQKIAEQVAADEALIASPPPRPDPAARRPTAKEKRAEFLRLTPEEQAEADRRIGISDDEAARKAADAKLVQDKADADKLAAANK